MKIGINENSTWYKHVSIAGLGAVATFALAAWSGLTALVVYYILQDGCVNISSRIVLGMVGVIYVYVIGYVLAGLHDHGKKCGGEWRNVVKCMPKEEPAIISAPVDEEDTTKVVEKILKSTPKPRGRPKTKASEDALDLEYEEPTR